MVNALRIQTADMRAMRDAVTCCFAQGDLAYILRPYTPGTPDGDCLGGVFTLVVGQEF
jgi:hypothetical protein